ncbi:hypothetical protein GGE65_006530 [Skermanella aerolata]|uniref:Uncharacterized protein n=1 Tax=Skermanella aerolata TaxID=393310 RepID=A0A512DWT8_9PROT|nr:hypothetical protein [Skermanella aerolata]GEO40906.1 hypothetical protein SAE02_50540 [Skermanella aerolata]
MPPKINDPVNITSLSIWLHHLIRRYLSQNRLIDANVSTALLYDVALHWKNDIINIEASKTVDVRPVEHAGYLAFWIRKLKPISQAYYVSDLKAAEKIGMAVDPTSEIIDINEQAAIRLAFAHLAGCCQYGQIATYDTTSQELLILKYESDKFSASVQKYLGQKFELDGRTVMESIIYDMRYRTFGPYHLVHIFDQFIFSLQTQALAR